MKTPSRLALSLFVAVFVSLSFSAASAQQLVSRASRGSTLPPASTISTLYSNDPIAHTLCLTDGREGGVFQDGQARNRCSHIDFDTYKAGSLSVGIQGGEVGAIVDLGNWQDLHTNQAFPNVRFVDGKIMLVKEPRAGKPEELTRAARVFEPSTNMASIEALPGHIYLARITDRHDKDFQILVKLLVLTVKPGESVTFRWELL
jgi:hypothetical protein